MKHHVYSLINSSYGAYISYSLRASVEPFYCCRLLLLFKMFTQTSEPECLRILAQILSRLPTTYIVTGFTAHITETMFMHKQNS